MKEYTITRYSFEDLSPEAQENRSLENYGYKWLEEWSSEAHAREEIEEAGDIFLISGKVDRPAGVNA